MNALLRALCCLSLLLLASAAALADGESDKEIARLIEQLGDDELDVRRAAEQKLNDLAEQALPQLRQAAKSHLDADVRLRAIRLLRSLDVREFKGHDGDIRHIAVSKDGKTALTAAMDATVRLWELKTGRELKRFAPHDTWAWCVAFSPDETRVLSSDAIGKSLKLWDLASGKELRKYTGHTGRVYAAAFSPDGKYVLSSGAETDTVARLYETETGKEVRKFEGHTGWVWRAVFSPDGKKVATAGCNDKSYRVWDVETGKPLVIGTNAHDGHVEGLCFSPDGKHLLTSGRDLTCKLWEVETGKLARTYKGSAENVETVAFSPDGKRFLAGETGGVCVFDAHTGRVVHRFEEHTGRVFAVAWLPNGLRALSGGEDRVMRMWGVPK
jgi:WD40 repeat protein